MIWSEDYGKGHRTDLIVDDGGDTTLLTHERKKEEDFPLKDGTIHDPVSTENIEFNIVQTIIKCQLEGGEKDKWNKKFNTCMVFSKDTFTGVHHMYNMENTGNNHQNW